MNRLLLSLVVAVCGMVLPGSTAFAAKEKLGRPALERYLKSCGYTVIRLDHDSSGRLELAARIGDKKIRTGLATGLRVSALDKARRWPFHSPVQHGMVVKDDFLGDIEDDQVRLIPSLTLDGTVFTNQIAVVMDANRLGYDALLGLDFLVRNQALVDCLDGRLYVRSSPPTESVQEALAASLRKNGYEDVPLTYSRSELPTVPIQVNGVALNMLVSTSLAFTALDEEAVKATGITWYQGSTSTRFKLDPKSLTIKGRRIPFQGTVLGVDLGPGESGPDRAYGGALSADLLTSCQVLLDIPQKRFWFLPEDVVKATEAQKKVIP